MTRGLKLANYTKSCREVAAKVFRDILKNVKMHGVTHPPLEGTYIISDKSGKKTVKERKCKIKSGN